MAQRLVAPNACPLIMASDHQIPDEKVNLSQIWHVGDLLHAGGFARVYHARSEGEVAVAKFIPKDPGAQRELLFEDFSAARNVVPIRDRGE